ncbi:MAG: hypothetical protein Q8L55_03405 [Phycisphaerales bacterium]|nr:hypothetical protein [Phycisphaerales bacterium]
MTLFPVAAAAAVVTGLVLAVRNPGMDEQTFLTQHRTVFRTVEYSTIGVYFVAMLIWESAIRKRIAAGR